MNQALKHRGPDGEGVWSNKNENIFLGHTRLSIIDLHETANQPLISSCGRWVIVFNGEIYNYKALRKICESKGSSFKTNSDTEVILECYRQLGADFLSQLIGMWAFVIYDTKEETLFISRDPFGIKPLYFAYDSESLYFSSEIKSFFTLGDRFKQIDEVSYQLFIESAISDRGPWTFFKEIQRFPHAHYAIVNLKKSLDFKTVRYWQVSTQINKNIKYDDAVEELKARLLENVKLHMVSDVPVGISLSGGIDSSGIINIVNRLNLQNKTYIFSNTFPEYPEIDELEWAKYSINPDINKHIPVYPNYHSFIDGIDNLILNQDEPFQSFSIYSQAEIYRSSKLNGIKVLLSGQGADEQFSGYFSFIDRYLRSLFSDKNYFTGITQALSFTNDKREFLSYLKLIFKRSTPSHFIESTKDISENIDSASSRLDFFSTPERSFNEFLGGMLTEVNLPMLLRFEDRNSMYSSVESRVPYLTTEFVNYVMSLPTEFKYRDGFTKKVLRDSLAELVPRNVLERKSKLGLPAPELKWIAMILNKNVGEVSQKDVREFIGKRWRKLVEAS